MKPNVTTVGKSTTLSGSAGTTRVINNIQNYINMAQSAYFTVTIEQISALTNGFGKRPHLPLKNISFTFASLETMQVPISILKDVPIVTGIRLPKMTLTLLDTAKDEIESDFRSWYKSTVPISSNCVNYMSNMLRTLTYTSYNIDGTVNNTRVLYVMLADEINVSRDYESNELKTIEVNLIILNEKN